MLSIFWLYIIYIMALSVVARGVWFRQLSLCSWLIREGGGALGSSSYSCLGAVHMELVCMPLAIVVKDLRPFYGILYALNRPLLELCLWVNAKKSQLIRHTIILTIVFKLSSIILLVLFMFFLFIQLVESSLEAFTETIDMCKDVAN